MSLLWKVKRRCLPAFQDMLTGFTLSIVLFILVHPQRTYKVPTVYVMDDLENRYVDELGQLTKNISQKVELNYGKAENIGKSGEGERDSINEEEQEMTDEERSKIDKEFIEEEEKEKKENAKSKCKYFFSCLMYT